MRNILKNVASNENDYKWSNTIKRDYELYSRGNDIRSDFERDYTRIIHSLAFRRMKHKTQVFFSPVNDHICTRMEHVILVESISDTIASYLLYDYNCANQYNPYTWEACVVKIADKIAYLGRDIQDAITLEILDEHLRELRNLIGINENNAQKRSDI